MFQIASVIKVISIVVSSWYNNNNYNNNNNKIFDFYENIYL